MPSSDLFFTFLIYAGAYETQIGRADIDNHARFNETCASLENAVICENDCIGSYDNCMEKCVDQG